MSGPAGVFKTLAYVGASDAQMLVELTAAAAVASAGDVANSRMSAEGQARSRHLYYVLVLMLEGSALQLVKAVPSGEGYRVLASPPRAVRTSDAVEARGPSA